MVASLFVCFYVVTWQHTHGKGSSVRVFPQHVNLPELGSAPRFLPSKGRVHLLGKRWGSVHS